jgi:hypothetical protein
MLTLDDGALARLVIGRMPRGRRSEWLLETAARFEGQLGRVLINPGSVSAAR